MRPLKNEVIGKRVNAQVELKYVAISMSTFPTDDVVHILRTMNNTLCTNY